MISKGESFKSCYRVLVHHSLNTKEIKLGASVHMIVLYIEENERGDAEPTVSAHQLRACVCVCVFYLSSCWAWHWWNLLPFMAPSLLLLD